MPNMSSFGILNEIVNQKKCDLNLDYIGLAFDYVALDLLLKLNEADIEDAITDGPDDGGLDAIHISNREVYFCNFKYTYDFKNTKKNFPGDELDKLCATLNLFISGELTRDHVNELVFEKYLEIKALLSEGPLNFHVLLASNKEHPVPRAKKKLEKTLNKFRFIDYGYINLEDLVEIILQNRIIRKDGTITLLNNFYFEKADGNIKTIIGIIAADDLIKIIRDENDNKKVNQFIFNENVRTYQPKHSINKDIIDSALADTNYQFFYLNNGITILCDQAKYQPNTRNPKVHLKNLQIINGGQTSNSLFEAYLKKPEAIQTIDLLIRICIVDRDDEISMKISESTNKQIPVKTRDLHSNDIIQKKLEAEFEQLGYLYERKPGKYKGQPQNKVLNNELLGQLYLAYYLDKPSDAKNNKNVVFGDYYEEIFNDERVNAKKLLFLYELYKPLLKRKKEIQYKKRKKEKVNEKESFISRATLHILNGMRHVSEFENLDMNKLKDRELAMEKSISFIYEIVIKEMDKRGDTYTHDKFFKEIPTNMIIKEHIMSKY